MSNALNGITYGDGERTCPACDRSLPAHDTWPGARLRYCGDSECREKLREHDNGRYVAPDSIRCDADGCGEFVPRVSTGPTQAFFVAALCAGGFVEPKGSRRCCARVDAGRKWAIEFVSPGPGASTSRRSIKDDTIANFSSKRRSDGFDHLLRST